MKLTSSDRIVRWAYFATENGPPSQVSLCIFFWRVVLITPLKVVSISAVTGLVLFCIGKAVYEAATHLRMMGIVFGAIAAVVAVIATPVLAYHRFRKVPVIEMTTEFIAAKKAKICPLIDIE